LSDAAPFTLEELRALDRGGLPGPSTRAARIVLRRLLVAGVFVFLIGVGWQRVREGETAPLIPLAVVAAAAIGQFVHGRLRRAHPRAVSEPDEAERLARRLLVEIERRGEGTMSEVLVLSYMVPSSFQVALDLSSPLPVHAGWILLWIVLMAGFCLQVLLDGRDAAEERSRLAPLVPRLRAARRLALDETREEAARARRPADLETASRALATLRQRLEDTAGGERR
jgi:hypothetical protein